MDVEENKRGDKVRMAKLLKGRGQCSCVRTTIGCCELVAVGRGAGHQWVLWCLDGLVKFLHFLPDLSGLLRHLVFSYLFLQIYATTSVDMAFNLCLALGNRR